MARKPVSAPAARTLTLGGSWTRSSGRRRFTTYPVVEDGAGASACSPSAAVAEVPRSEWADRRVRELMVPRDHIPVFSEDDELDDALQQLGGEAQHGVVVDGDSTIVGVPPASDVARAIEGGRRGGRLRGPIEI